MSKNVTRRRFLSTTGAVAAGAALNPVISRARAAGANERLTAGLIGCGTIGNADLRFMMNTGQIDVAALCDVDGQRAERTSETVQKQLNQKPKIFKDYRRVLDMQEVDIVLVTTPDHWHAIPMMAACAAGKDVYCEKPCSHNVREGRLMVQAAEKYNRIVQVGTFQRSIAHVQEARDYIRAGKLGQISMTRTYIYGNEAPDGMGHNPDTQAPEYVDYDMWLGPAPKRPFNRRRFHGSFRWYFDYATGLVGDWNVHLQDIIMWTLEAPYPVSVSATGGKYVLTDDRDTPDTMEAVYEFIRPDKTHFVQTFTMRQASGKPWNLPGGYGMEFHGTNGMLHLTRTDLSVTADAKDWRKKDSEMRTASFEKKGLNIYDPHIADFLKCVRSREKPIASIDDHNNTATACHLANVSLKVGRKLFWDHQKELCYQDRALTVVDNEANALLAREYRKGYELPEVL